MALKRAIRRGLITCRSCGKRHSNPLTHVCAGGGGFDRKRATAERRAKTAARRQRETEARRRRRAREEEARRARRDRDREAARARRAKSGTKAGAPASRAKRQAHEYRTCRDRDCARQACEAYRDGIEYGIELATAAAARS